MGGIWGKKPNTVVHGLSPFNAEASPAALAEHDITPFDVFYARNHGPIPEIGIDEWRLTVGGLVEQELTLTFDELTGRFAPRTVVATLQCAGNRRADFNKVREITGQAPWGPAATSTAQWRGARLADVLEAAGGRRPSRPERACGIRRAGRQHMGIAGAAVRRFDPAVQSPLRRGAVGVGDER